NSRFPNGRKRYRSRPTTVPTDTRVRDDRKKKLTIRDGKRQRSRWYCGFLTRCARRSRRGHNPGVEAANGARGPRERGGYRVAIPESRNREQQAAFPGLEAADLSW